MPARHLAADHGTFDYPVSNRPLLPCCSAQYGEAAWLAAGAPGDGDSAEAEDGSREGSRYDPPDTASEAPLPSPLPGGGARTLPRLSPFQS